MAFLLLLETFLRRAGSLGLDVNAAASGGNAAVHIGDFLGSRGNTTDVVNLGISYMF